MKSIIAIMLMGAALLFTSCEKPASENIPIPEQVSQWETGQDRSPRDGVLIFSESGDTVELNQPIVIKSGQVLDGKNPDTGKLTNYIRSESMLNIEQDLRGAPPTSSEASSTPSGESGDTSQFYGPYGQNQGDEGYLPTYSTSTEPLAQASPRVTPEGGGLKKSEGYSSGGPKPNQPMFKVEPGGILKNVIINDPHGVAVMAQIADNFITKIDNAQFTDVGPTGIFIYGNGGSIEITRGKFAYASKDAIRMDAGAPGKLLVKDCESWLCNDVIRLGSRIGPIQEVTVQGGSSRDVNRVIFAPGAQGVGTVGGGFRLFGNGMIGGNKGTKAKPYVRMSNKLTLGTINLDW